MRRPRVYKRGAAWVGGGSCFMHFNGPGAKGTALRFSQFIASLHASGRRDFQNGEKPCITIRDGLERFLVARINGIGKTKCNERTAALYRRRLLAFDRAFHSRPLDAIQAEDVERYMERRLKRPRRGATVSADTVNDEVDALKAFARWAQGKRLAPAALPLLTTQRLVTKGKVAGKNWRAPKIMQIDQLLGVMDRIKAVRQDIGLILYGMLRLNLRPSEVADLKFRDVLFPVGDADGTLTFRRIKTGGQEITMPIVRSSFLHGWVLECMALANRCGRPTTADSPLVICITKGSKYNPGGWSTGVLDKAMERTCRRLHISIRPYLIRHSITSYLHNQPDMPASAVTMMAGHTKTTTTEIYSHRTGKDALPAWERVEELLSGHARKNPEGRGGGDSPKTSV